MPFDIQATAKTLAAYPYGNDAAPDVITTRDAFETRILNALQTAQDAILARVSLILKQEFELDDAGNPPEPQFCNGIQYAVRVIKAMTRVIEDPRQTDMEQRANKMCYIARTTKSTKHEPAVGTVVCAAVDDGTFDCSIDVGIWIREGLVVERAPVWWCRLHLWTTNVYREGDVPPLAQSAADRKEAERGR